MKEVKVEVAKDQMGKIIPVSKISKSVEWTCVECNEKLWPRLGNKYRHHWAHKSQTYCSGGESYEHNIAKEIIQNEIQQCIFFKRCMIVKMCYGHCGAHKMGPLGSVKEIKWYGGTFYEILKQNNVIVYENLNCVLEDRSLQKELGMIPDVLLYKDGVPVGVIEVEHTNPKNKAEIDKLSSKFDGFFFELKAKDIIRGNLKKMKKEFSSYQKPLEMCYECKKIQAPYHCFTGEHGT